MTWASSREIPVSSKGDRMMWCGEALRVPPPVRNWSPSGPRWLLCCTPCVRFPGGKGGRALSPCATLLSTERVHVSSSCVAWGWTNAGSARSTRTAATDLTGTGADMAALETDADRIEQEVAAAGLVVNRLE